MIFADSVWTLAAQHAASFFFGLLVGLALSSRYRIVRINSHDDDEDDGE